MNTLVFMDYETSGLQDHHPNIQLAAVAVDEKWKELGVFERKIRFDEALAEPEALKINHYDPEVWKKEAKDERSVVAEFTHFLNQYKCVECISKRTGQPYMVARLAGHNAASFDKPRLDRAFKPDFLPAHPQVLDSQHLALWFFRGHDHPPKDYKLGTLCDYFGIPINAHDALHDVRGSIGIAKAMTERLVRREVAA